MKPTVNISPDQLKKGRQAYASHEGRDSIYRVATFLIQDQWWGQHLKMADGITVLLLTWNAPFYRFGKFDHGPLEHCLAQNWTLIEGFRTRDINSFGTSDHKSIRILFADFLYALKISEGKNRGRRSPVAVAKTLHLLAPGFFPLWDEWIACEYNCSYEKDAAEAYIRFCGCVRNVALDLAHRISIPQQELLKAIDEFNYARYSKGWIK
jgi:hypothetical protein